MEFPHKYECTTCGARFSIFKVVTRSWKNWATQEIEEYPAEVCPNCEDGDHWKKFDFDGSVLMQKTSGSSFIMTAWGEQKK